MQLQVAIYADASEAGLGIQIERGTQWDVHVNAPCSNCDLPVAFGTAIGSHCAGAALGQQTSLWTANIDVAGPSMKLRVSVYVFQRDVAGSGSGVHRPRYSPDTLIPGACRAGDLGIGRNRDVVADGDVAAQLVLVDPPDVDRVSLLLYRWIVTQALYLGLTAHAGPGAARPYPADDRYALGVAGTHVDVARSGLNLDNGFAGNLQRALEAAFASLSKIAGSRRQYQRNG